MSDIIQLLGDHLATLTGKDAPAMRGLIRLALKRDGEDASRATIDSLVSVFQTTLKDKLVKLNVANADSVIGDLIKEVRKNQSLITMMAA